jgi:hypothetical protein
MRRWVRFTVLGTMLAALAVPPAHAKGAAASATAAAKAPVATPTGAVPWAAFYVPTEEEVSNPAPAPPPPPARPRPAAKLPLCHEVTSVGVVVERASACSTTPR